MAAVLRDIASVCIALAAAELAARLCPKNKAVSFVGALAVLVMLVSAVTPLFSLEFDISDSIRQSSQSGEELENFISGQTMSAAEKDFTEYIEGLFATVQMKAEKIEVDTDIREDGCIVLTKVSALFKFESESQRAHVLLKNTLGDEVEVEVQTDGH